MDLRANFNGTSLPRTQESEDFSLCFGDYKHKNIIKIPVEGGGRVPKGSRGQARREVQLTLALTSCQKWVTIEWIIASHIASGSKVSESRAARALDHVE
eukprot:960066-Amphidinium_carterae.2